MGEKKQHSIASCSKCVSGRHPGRMLKFDDHITLRCSKNNQINEKYVEICLGPMNGDKIAEFTVKSTKVQL